MRVLVTGSRDWPYPGEVYFQLDRLFMEHLTTINEEFVVQAGIAVKVTEFESVEG